MEYMGFSWSAHRYWMGSFVLSANIGRREFGGVLFGRREFGGVFV
jgi:hypothetical protein